MGVLDKFKELVGIEEIDEDDIEDEVKASLESKPLVPQDRTPDIRPSSTARPAITAPAASQPVSGVKKETTKFTSKFNMVVIEPAGFDESPKLVDSLKAKKPVIINLENLETDTARKIFDFLSGATYALNGNVQKVANNIFVFAPENVSVSYNDGQKPASAAAAEAGRNPWR